MKSKIVLISIALLLSVGVFAQEKSTHKEERQLKGFNTIKASSGIDVVLLQDDDYKVIVEASKSYAHKIKTEIKANVLRIYVEGRFSWKFNEKKTVYVSAPEYKMISASGGSDIVNKGIIKCGELKLNASGGSDIHLKIEATNIELNASGGGDIQVEGNTDNLNANASGGGDIDAKKLIANNVTVSTSGGGDAYVFATKKLNAKASGGGDIHYSGSPADTKINKSGGGDVKRF